MNWPTGLSPETIALSSVGPRVLGWDGAVHEGEKDEDYFRWIIRHETQLDPEWCWAACVRNALSCFAVELAVGEIANDLQALFPKGTGSTGKRIPLELIVPFWKRQGFGRVTRIDRPIDEDRLKLELEQNGPVQLEIWPDVDSALHHLILVTGFRSTNGSTVYGVSDPLAASETWSSTYEDLRAAHEGWRWKRTYCGLDYQRSALRRFVFSPARYYADFDLKPPDPDQGRPPIPMFGGTKLQVQDVRWTPRTFRAELSSALNGYRHYRWRDFGERKALSKTLWLGESLPRVSLRRNPDPQVALHEQWTLEGWASIVYVDGRAKYYVWSQLLKNGEWYSRWVGEAWARALAAGLRELTRIADGDEQVEMVRVDFSRVGNWDLYLLRLVESDRYLVAHVEGRERPLKELLSGEELAERLGSETPLEFADGLTEIGDDLWG